MKYKFYLCIEPKGRDNFKFVFSQGYSSLFCYGLSFSITSLMASRLLCSLVMTTALSLKTM